MLPLHQTPILRREVSTMVFRANRLLSFIYLLPLPYINIITDFLKKVKNYFFKVK